MTYLTLQPEQAEKFNGKDHAKALSALGFTPEELPLSVQRSGETFGLRNANGDWITSLAMWYRHDPRAMKIGIGKSLSRCGDDQCQCRYGNPCPKEDQN
jgi:hypothetical protein